MDVEARAHRRSCQFAGFVERPELTNEADLHCDGKHGAQHMLDVRTAQFNGRFELCCGMLAPVKSSVTNDNAFAVRRNSPKIIQVFPLHLPIKSAYGLVEAIASLEFVPQPVAFLLLPHDCFGQMYRP